MLRKYCIYAQRHSIHVQKAPFGLKPLSSLFQRGMNRLLGDLPFVRNFIDDIVVFSRNRKEHAEHVKNVIERLNEAKLILNRDKCNFFSTKITLLGFQVGLHGRSVDLRKLIDLHKLEYPTSGKQIQSYLGTLTFFVNIFLITAQSQLHLMHYETDMIYLNLPKTKNKPLTL